MKTLLQINTTLGWNATGHITDTIGRMALANGWESYIAFGRGALPLENPSNIIKVGNSTDHNLHGFITRLGDAHGLGSREATDNLIRQIEQIAPDVIQLHNIHGYYLNYRLLFDFLKRSGIPVVWTLHDCWPFTGHCAYYEFSNTTKSCPKWQNGCHDCPKTAEYPKSLVDRSRRNFELKREAFTGVGNLHIVAVSQWLKGEVGKSFLKDYPVEVIYNGVDIPEIQPKKSREGVDVLSVASVWDERKGLRTFYRLREILPESYRITLVGLTRRQIRRLPAGITGAERTDSREELNRLYAGADVYVSASVSETLGMTSLEAQAAGTPVAAYASGGIPETIGCGVAVAPGDVMKLAKAVADIAARPVDAAKCRGWVRERFSHDNFLQYLALYDRLLGNNA